MTPALLALFSKIPIGRGASRYVRLVEEGCPQCGGRYAEAGTTTYGLNGEARNRPDSRSCNACNYKERLDDRC